MLWFYLFIFSDNPIFLKFFSVNFYRWERSAEETMRGYGGEAALTERTIFSPRSRSRAGAITSMRWSRRRAGSWIASCPGRQTARSWWRWRRGVITRWRRSSTGGTSSGLESALSSAPEYSCSQDWRRERTQAPPSCCRTSSRASPPCSLFSVTPSSPSRFLLQVRQHTY